MDLTPRQKRKVKREKLFKEQRGKCHWCNKDMTLEESGKHGDPLPNFATFEHLYDRFDPLRDDWKLHTQLGVRRIVLACRTCNHQRAKLREEAHKRNNMPITARHAGPERRKVYSTE